MGAAFFAFLSASSYLRRTSDTPAIADTETSINRVESSGTGSSTNTLANEALSPSVIVNLIWIPISAVAAGPSMLGIGVPNDAGPVLALRNGPADTESGAASSGCHPVLSISDRYIGLPAEVASVPPLPLLSVLPPTTDPPVREVGPIGDPNGNDTMTV